MPGLLPDIDPDGLLEFSVVYTDRALNHMSKRFTGVVQDILGTLKEVYHAHTAVLVPGSGTFGMEAVARQFANKEKVLISAPQKGWSGSPCCAVVILSERAREAIGGTTSSSFSCDLKKWMQIAEGYEKGQHAYHTTMPTDALVRLREVMAETREYGFAKVRDERIEL